MHNTNPRVRVHYDSMIRSRSVHLIIATAFAAIASAVVASIDRVPFSIVFVPLIIGWALSSWLTDAYNHKYPQRYYHYLLASRCKAAAVLGFFLILLTQFAPFETGATSTFRAAVLAVVSDLLVSIPRRRMKEKPSARPFHDRNKSQVGFQLANLSPVDDSEICRLLRESHGLGGCDALVMLIEECMQGQNRGPGSFRLVDGDVTRAEEQNEPVAFLLQKKPMNSVRRLNMFLEGLPGSVLMGGYFAFRYLPMEEDLAKLRSKKRGLKLWLSYAWHFFWYRALPKTPVLEKVYFTKYFESLDSWVYQRTKDRRRVVSRAEMWGRMYYWGFEILDERRIGEDYWVVTRRVRDPETNSKPSFFLVTRLTKVGLDGQPLHIHKLRTMYPFSEFVQEKIFNDHGLSETGKFKNDFRLTDYGRFLRRYWLDEIPQIFDWLRGEIKLVGMRATSSQFLSLYPKGVYDLYVQTKPGLIPPIFDGSTSGFEDIVKIELAYLNAYQDRPVATDVRYFFKTVHDIVIRGVRSK